MATSNELAFIPTSSLKQNATWIDVVDDFVEVPSPARPSDRQYAPLLDNKDDEGHGIYKQWIANCSYSNFMAAMAVGDRIGLGQRLRSIVLPDCSGTPATRLLYNGHDNVYHNFSLQS